MRNICLPIILLFAVIAGIESKTCTYKKMTYYTYSYGGYYNTLTTYKTAYRYCSYECCSTRSTGCCSSSYSSYSGYYRSTTWIYYVVGGTISGITFLIFIIVAICAACNRKNRVTRVVGAQPAGGVTVVSNSNQQGAMQQPVPMYPYGPPGGYSNGPPGGYPNGPPSGYPNGGAPGYPYGQPTTAGYPYYNQQAPVPSEAPPSYTLPGQTSDNPQATLPTSVPEKKHPPPGPGNTSTST